ncbi:hypothetical protein NDU88_001613 [Pleurodeles waltl]|uniref:Uncharacterized protein n=1 Tax=Pleurodeles waltl TaxID=8319 RepID=A0AAV7L9Z9_PLEWA|nr:hypothetical protein NDU88_001613 [Pleurodeles waltl]
MGSRSGKSARPESPPLLRRERCKSAGFPSRPEAPALSRQARAHPRALSEGFQIAVSRCRHTRGASWGQEKPQGGWA